MTKDNNRALKEALKILKSNNLLITGGAGTGKSHLTREIIKEYEKKSKSVVTLGSTGVSAVNIGGFTIHSFFAFGISSNLEELKESDRRNKKRLVEIKKIIEKCDLIIIDEISMVSADLMEMIKYRLNSMGFNGKLLMVGDFYQLPPVIKSNRVTNSLFGDRIFAFESDAWRFFEPITLELIESKRTKDKYFEKVLSKIRRGNIDNETIEYLQEISNKKLPNNTQNFTILYSKNIDVDRINIDSMNKLEGETKNFNAIIDNKKNIHPSRLKKWQDALPINLNLSIKKGSPLLFTINKWGSYYNGERGVFKDINDDYLIIEKSDKIIKVQRYDFELKELKPSLDGVENETVATLSQFPLKLAYAITIHKSQGMGIDNLICNIDGIFAPSQFYVAISRAINPKNLYIEYSRRDFSNYLYRIIRVDDRVLEWENSVIKRVEI